MGLNIEIFLKYEQHFCSSKKKYFFSFRLYFNKELPFRKKSNSVTGWSKFHSSEIHVTSMSFELLDNRQSTVVYGSVNLDVKRSVNRGSFA